MEKRTLLAVVLSLGILLGWSYFFQKPVPQKPAPAGQSDLSNDQAVKPETVKPAEQVPAEIAPAMQASAASDIIVETELVQSRFLH